jgi:uncharacterized membrane protein
MRGNYNILWLIVAVLAIIALIIFIVNNVSTKG